MIKNKTKIKRTPILSFVTIVFVIFSCTQPGDSAKRKTPNIMVILADDMGYSDLGCYGGEIQTPNLDNLAYNGLRMTQFYNCARCCPTRASLLTGLYPHQAGMGDMVEGRMLKDSTKLLAYQGYLGNNCVTMAELLRERGYETIISGKWHVGDQRDCWPDKRGFEKSFSLINGASNYFNLDPWLDEDQEIILTLNGEEYEPGEDFYMTRAITEHAIEFLKEKEKQKPFFLYLAYTAPHWPLHALPADIRLFEGRYLDGWDSIRLRRFRKMKQLDIIPSKAGFTEDYFKNGFLTPSWDTLSNEEKETFDRRMAVHAAMIYRMDKGIGRIMDHLKSSRQMENTLMIFLSDNGASKASIYLATQWYADRSGPIGSAQSFDSQGPKWANASNSPFKLFKTDVYEGGICTPFIAHWPKIIKPGLISNQTAHVMDIMATCLDISHTKYPATFNNKLITPLQGESLLPVFQNEHITADRAICFEHQGNKAIRYGKWKLCYSTDPWENPHGKWKLYNIENDRTETTDLSSKNPHVKNELMRLWEEWAEKVGVENWNDLILIREL